MGGVGAQDLADHGPALVGFRHNAIGFVGFIQRQDLLRPLFGAITARGILQHIPPFPVPSGHNNAGFIAFGVVTGGGIHGNDNTQGRRIHMPNAAGFHHIPRPQRPRHIPQDFRRQLLPPQTGAFVTLFHIL